MANSKQTRAALLVSLVSLILCCAVFVGTTFAWLSEKIDTGNHLLVGGNLELAVYKGEVSGSEVFYTQPVTDTTRLFEPIPWLPGVTQTVYLKLENKGRIPLQYELNLCAGAEVASMGAVGPILLSDLLYFGVLENAAGGMMDMATLGAAAVPFEKEAGTVMTGYQSVGKAAGTLQVGEVTYLTLVVCLPEQKDVNCLPGNPVPSLEFGVTLAVSQLGETDLFGQEQVLPLPGVEVVPGRDVMTWDTTFISWMAQLTGGGSVCLPGTPEQAAPAVSFEKVPSAGVPVGMTDRVESYRLFVENGSEIATVTLPVPADAWDVSLLLNGQPLVRRAMNDGPMEAYEYDYNTIGKTVTFLVDQFPAAITMVTHQPALTVNGVGYAGLAQAFAAVDTVPLQKDLRLSAPVVLNGTGKSLLLSGRTLVGGFAAGQEPGLLSVHDGSLVITESGKVIAPANGYSIYVDGSGVVTVENGDYSGGLAPFFAGPGGTLSITGGSFRFAAPDVPVTLGGTVTVTGGVFVNFDPTPYLAEGYQVTVAENVYTVSAVQPGEETPGEVTPDEEISDEETPDEETPVQE